jgi:hypothetical protein
MHRHTDKKGEKPSLELRDDPSDEEEGDRPVVQEASEDEFEGVWDEGEEDPDSFSGGVQRAVQSTPGPRCACEVVNDNDECNEVVDADYENMKAMMQGIEFEKD